GPASARQRLSQSEEFAPRVALAYEPVGIGEPGVVDRRHPSQCDNDSVLWRPCVLAGRQAVEEMPRGLCGMRTIIHFGAAVPCLPALQRRGEGGPNDLRIPTPGAQELDRLNPAGLVGVVTTSSRPKAVLHETGEDGDECRFLACEPHDRLEELIR